MPCGKVEASDTCRGSSDGGRRFVSKNIPEYEKNLVQLMKRWLKLRTNNRSTILYRRRSSGPALNKICVRPPKGCIYQSHSFRIAAYTEISLQETVRFDNLMMQFNWQAREMPMIYLDH